MRRGEQEAEHRFWPFRPHCKVIFLGIRDSEGTRTGGWNGKKRKEGRSITQEKCCAVFCSMWMFFHVFFTSVSCSNAGETHCKQKRTIFISPAGIYRASAVLALQSTLHRSLQRYTIVGAVAVAAVLSVFFLIPNTMPLSMAASITQLKTIHMCVFFFFLNIVISTSPKKYWVYLVVGMSRCRQERWGIGI